MDGLQEGLMALSGEEDRSGACDLIAQAEGALRSIVRYDPSLEELAEQLSGLRSAADDAAELLRIRPGRWSSLPTSWTSWRAAWM